MKAFATNKTAVLPPDREGVMRSPVPVANPGVDPYLKPSFPLSNRLRRLIWNLCWAALYRPSPRPFHAWRSLLLRSFGARMGRDCHFYPGSRVWAPWNLQCEDCASMGDGAEVYNPSPVYLASHAIISQQAYLCTATHDFCSPDFPLISSPITLGAYSWICARATVAPGVRVGDGAVLGLGSVATHDLKPWSIYGGVPARWIKERPRPR